MQFTTSTHLAKLLKFRLPSQKNLLNFNLPKTLRRTVGAWLAQDGNSLFLIGKVLNHKSEDATRVYAHLADDSIKSALEKHGSQIMPMLSSLRVEEAFVSYLHDMKCPAMP